MSNTSVFMVANLTVTNADEYRNYEKGFFPILKRHGGEFLTFDDNSDTLEGSTSLSGRVILFKFPSEAAARAWWEDPDYQELSKHRRQGTETHFLTMIHGLPPRN